MTFNHVSRPSISIIFGGKICTKISYLYILTYVHKNWYVFVIPVKKGFSSDVKNRCQILIGVPMVCKLQDIADNC